MIWGAGGKLYYSRSLSTFHMPWQVQTNMHWHAQGTRRPDGGAVTSWRPPCPSRQSKRSRRTRPGPSLAGVTTNLKDPKRLGVRKQRATGNKPARQGPQSSSRSRIPIRQRAADFRKGRAVRTRTSGARFRPVDPPRAAGSNPPQSTRAARRLGLPVQLRPSHY